MGLAGIAKERGQLRGFEKSTFGYYYFPIRAQTQVQKGQKQPEGLTSLRYQSHPKNKNNGILVLGSWRLIRQHT